jgi:hypothetical protein
MTASSFLTYTKIYAYNRSETRDDLRRANEKDRHNGVPEYAAVEDVSLKVVILHQHLHRGTGIF